LEETQTKELKGIKIATMQTEAQMTANQLKDRFCRENIL